jgi:hypothetical protein
MDPVDVSLGSIAIVPLSNISLLPDDFSNNLSISSLSSLIHNLKSGNIVISIISNQQ